jgi:CubicO group peptidase (beta-lactamase class C family)
MFAVGSGIGYDALTYGLYADFLLRKVDKQGRSLSQFFQEEIAEPFGRSLQRVS